MKLLISLVFVVISSVALANGSHDHPTNNDSSSESNSGAISGAVSGSVSGASNSTDIATQTSVSTSSSNTASANGGNGQGGNSETGDIEVTNQYSEDTLYEAPILPANSSYTRPSICTSSTAASGFKISVSSSQTDTTCLLMDLANSQWEKASGITCHDHHPECVIMRATLMSQSLTTMQQLTDKLKRQSKSNRLHENVMKWLSAIGMVVIMVAI